MEIICFVPQDLPLRKLCLIYRPCTSKMSDVENCSGNCFYFCGTRVMYRHNRMNIWSARKVYINNVPTDNARLYQVDRTRLNPGRRVQSDDWIQVSDRTMYINISVTARGIEKMRHMTFAEVDVRHQMLPLCILCCVTIILMFKIKHFLVVICYKHSQAKVVPDRFAATRTAPAVV